MSVFYSFHYSLDHWRVQQIRNINVIENAGSIASQEWERVRYYTDSEIKNWINDQMSYKSAVVVLIGSETASRPWVQYEIERALSLNKPLLGIRIHGLKDHNGNISLPGESPFEQYKDCRIPIFDPLGVDSKSKYADIKSNLKTWVTRGYQRK